MNYLQYEIPSEHKDRDRCLYAFWLQNERRVQDFGGETWEIETPGETQA